MIESVFVYNHKKFRVNNEKRFLPSVCSFVRQRAVVCLHAHWLARERLSSEEYYQNTFVHAHCIVPSSTTR